MKFDLIGVFFIGLLTSGLILVRGYGDVLMSDNLLENVDEIVVNHDDFNSFEKRLLSSTESEKSSSRNLKGYLVNKRRKCLKYYYWYVCVLLNHLLYVLVKSFTTIKYITIFRI